ncbi:hypothetical protein [Streptomyces sp. SID3343]|uniref:hypothetical protein n=1 Tax=Streptomyces sp. SID3343 TaxID=2690260 RepID=UPI00136891CB|nr:hypothetical protein [Streptomyces sp. SID3343]MYW00412.1 hypothetical protein [Streptomyces sp. SID3343]
MTGRQELSTREMSKPRQGIRWWTRRTTQAAAMFALMIVALAVGPSLGIVPSLSQRVDGVVRISDVVHDSDAPVHTR